MNLSKNIMIVGSAWGGRIVSAVVSLISVRVLLSGLGSQQYAVFAVLSSLVGWYALTDFGAGTSVQNYISEQRAKGKGYSSYIVAVAVATLAMLVLETVLLYFVSPYLGSAILGEFKFLGSAEKTRLFFVSGALYLVASLGGIVFKIWYAEIRGHLSNIVPALSAVLGLAATWMVMRSSVHDKLLLGLIAFITPLALISTLAFGKNAARAASRCATIQPGVFREIRNRAGRFWLLYLMHAAVVNCDYIIMSQYLPAKEIVGYNIAFKIFAFSAFFYTSLYAALWPNFTEAISRGDWAGVKKTLYRSILFSTLLIAVFTVLGYTFMPNLVALLSPNEQITVPPNFILLLGTYHVVIAWVHGFGIPLQSMSDIRTLLIWTPIQAILSICLQIMLVSYLGIYGITLGMLLSFLLTMAWVLPRRVAICSRDAQMAST